MTAMERIKERYQNDPRFHALVDTLRREIVELELSPSEIREAAMFAAYMVESERPTGPCCYDGSLECMRETLRHVVAAMAAEEGEAVSEAEEARAECERLRGELAVCREQYDRRTAQHIDEKRLLRNDLTTARARIAELEAEVASLRKHAAKAANIVSGIPVPL